MKTHNRKPANDVNAQERATQALKLRKLGFQYEEIAQQCGYANKGIAWNAVQRLLSKQRTEAVDQLRDIETQRLDDLMRPFMLRAMKGEKDAALVVLRIMERRAKLLGLDAEIEQDAVRNLERAYYGVNVVEATSNGHQLSAPGSSTDPLSLPRA